MLPTSAELVRTFREVRGWTQARAAAWYGCHERTWRRWERDGWPVPGRVLKRIAATRVATTIRKG